MSDPRGELRLTANGRAYRLHLGMSVLAELQARHGQDVLQSLEPPANVSATWLPPLAVVVDLFRLALERYHGDEADPYLVDDILAENADAFGQLMAQASPKARAEDAPRGNAPKARRAART